jgi:hypothetical protein
VKVFFCGFGVRPQFLRVVECGIDIVNRAGTDGKFLRLGRYKSKTRDLPDNDNKTVIDATEDRFCGFTALKDGLGSAERSEHPCQRE